MAFKTVCYPEELDICLSYIFLNINVQKRNNFEIYPGI